MIEFLNFAPLRLMFAAAHTLRARWRESSRSREDMPANLPTIAVGLTRLAAWLTRSTGRDGASARPGP